MPFFTIGLPVYNTSKFLGECLDSILSQSFSDFEVVCVDDGSTDSSLEILKEYAAKDSRIRIFSRSNCGVSATRNAITYLATGEYIFYLDSDDIMYPDALKNAYNQITINEYPDVLQASYKEIYYGKELEWHCHNLVPYFEQDINGDERTIRMWLDNVFKTPCASRFLKTNFIKTCGISFNINYFASEDSDFTIQMFRKAKTVVCSDFYTFTYYCPREGSATMTASIKTLTCIAQHWRNFYEELNFWDISAESRERVKAKQTEFYGGRRDILFDLFSKKSKAEIMEIAEMTEKVLGEGIKKLPLPKGSAGIVCFLFRIIGIPRTMSLLHRFLSIKGLTKKD